MTTTVIPLEAIIIVMIYQWNSIFVKGLIKARIRDYNKIIGGASFIYNDANPSGTIIEHVDRVLYCLHYYK